MKPACLVQSEEVSTNRTLADSRLVSLLQDLLSEEQLPPLDRWFSHQAKGRGWTVLEQRQLWNELRKAMVRGYELLPSAGAASETFWAGFRIAIRGRAQEWAVRTAHKPVGKLTPVAAGIPGWLNQEWEDRLERSRWSEEAQQVFLESQEVPSPVYVRFQYGTLGEACQNRFSSLGLIEPTEIAGFYRLTGLQGLETSEEWKKGLVEIQDASSQLSLRKLGLRPGQRVWDVCAGRGGKTLLAATELRGKGALVATDVAEMKLKSLKDRVRRSGYQNIRLLPWGGDELPDFGLEFAQGGGFDRVIVDAPCSASGTWRRDPESRYRLTPRMLNELEKHQQRLIRLGWNALKPGGLMAYITCSWFPRENEKIIEEFCDESGAAVVHQELLGIPLFDANTLFVAILEKQR